MLQGSINVLLTFKMARAFLVLHGEELKPEHAETKVTQSFQRTFEFK
jgi:hypothetical protein